MALTRATPAPRPMAGRRQHQYDDLLDRPEPDLHLAPLAPGVPARIRDGGRQAGRRPASCWTAHRRPRELGRRQGAGPDNARHQADRRRRRQRAAAASPTPMASSSAARTAIAQMSWPDGTRPASSGGQRRRHAGRRPTRSAPATPSSTTSRTTRCPAPGDHDSNPATRQDRSDADTVAGTADDGNPGTYDDELLNAHFITGDGRGNENIGLTAVHHLPLRAQPPGRRQQGDDPRARLRPAIRQPAC